MKFPLVLIIDNFDSFVYNLARYTHEIGFDSVVVRNDLSLAELIAYQPTHLILSPGPCAPKQAGITLRAIQYFYNRIPLLGVCLGHQAIAEAFGLEVVRSESPCHGKQDFIQHHDDLFHGIPNPMKVGRYHSLIVKESDCNTLEIIARNGEGQIMALKHKDHPTYGVQFHPESILTEYGHLLLKNFLEYR